MALRISIVFLLVAVLLLFESVITGTPGPDVASVSQLAPASAQPPQ